MHRGPIALCLLSVICLRALGGPEQPPLELLLQTGHSGPIHAAALSADGKYVVTASSDNTAILWDVATGRQTRTYRGHRGPLTSVAVSGDGRSFVTGSEDETAIVWDASGKKLRTFEGHKAKVTGVAMSGDGKRVVTWARGSDEEGPVLWDVTSGKQIRTFKSEEVQSVSLSRDGSRVLIASKYESTVWDGATGKKLRRFEEHGSETGPAMSGDGRYVATVSPDAAMLWDVASGKKVRSFMEEDTLVSVGISDDGSFVVAALGFGGCFLWEVASGKRWQRLGREVQGHAGVAVSNDGKRVLTKPSPRLGRPVLWDSVSGKKLTAFPTHTEWLRSVSVSDDGRFVATGGALAAVWDLAAGKRVQTFWHKDLAGSVALSGDGKHVLTGSWNGAHLWRVSDAVLVYTIQGHDQPVYALALSADARTIVTASEDRTAVLWQEGKKVHTFEGHTDRIRGVALSSDCKLVLTGSIDRTAMLWDALTGKKLRTLNAGGYVAWVSLTRDGRFAFTGSLDTVVWDIGTGKKVRTIEGYGLALSADAAYLVTGLGDNTPALWDAGNGNKLHALQGHSRGVMSAAISGDGKYVWTASLDGTTRLWDLAMGGERCRLLSLADGKEWLVVTADGHFDGSPGAWRFITYSVPGTLKVLDDDATRRRFHRRGLLAKMWKSPGCPGDERRAVPAAQPRPGNDFRFACRPVAGRLSPSSRGVCPCLLWETAGCPCAKA